MASQKSFGRKVPVPSPARRAAPAPQPLASPEPLLLDTPLPSLGRGDDVDAEVAEWNALRKAKRRSFREPWRTTSIVAGVGFGLSSWLLPDSVADIAQLVSGGLALAAFVVGFRPQSTMPDAPAAEAKPAMPARPATAAE
jgi:hypothetical protein